MIRNRRHGVINLLAMTREIYDPKPPPLDDKPASYDTRKLCFTRAVIRNRLLGLVNLPATMHAGYDPREL